MSDLTEPERQHLMAVVFSLEETLRMVLRPDKINLASLGNQVPHLHWHVIPRFTQDAHFPDPVWSERKRSSQMSPVNPAQLIQQLQTQLQQNLE